MPRNLSQAFIDALESGTFDPVVLVEFLFDSGPLRLWTGYGDLNWNALTWTGLGRLGNISPVEETSTLKATSVTFTISGVPPTLISIALNEDYQERPVSMYFGLMQRVKTEFVNNGGFGAGITGWTDSSSGDGSISWDAAGYLELNDTTTGDGIADQQLSGLVPNVAHILEYETIQSGLNGPSLWVGTTQGTNNFLSFFQAGLGVHRAVFTPTVSNPWLRINNSGVTTNTTVKIDNVSITRAGGVPKEVIVEPNLIYRGRMDVMEDKSDGNTASISISSVNRLQNLEDKNGRLYTAEDQKSMFPTDKGLDGLAKLADAKVQWR